MKIGDIVRCVVATGYIREFGGHAEDYLELNKLYRVDRVFEERSGIRMRPLDGNSGSAYAGVVSVPYDMVEKI